MDTLQSADKLVISGELVDKAYASMEKSDQTALLIKLSKAAISNLFDGIKDKVTYANFSGTSTLLDLVKKGTLAKIEAQPNQKIKRIMKAKLAADENALAYVSAISVKAFEAALTS